MIQVRHSTDLKKASAFLFSVLREDLQERYPGVTLTPEMLMKTISSMLLVEILDTTTDLIAGMAGMEADGHTHIHILKSYTLRWSPHRSLKQILDIFLAEREYVLASVFIENKNILGILLKLGFVLLRTKAGMAHLRLHASSRRILLASR
jgi:hypothetical protein